MNKRRSVLKKGAALGAIATLPAWQKPLVNAIVLPAHAQTSTATVSCSMTINGNPFPEGGSTNQDVFIIFETSPPQFNAPITWRGLCDGTDDFPPQTASTGGEFDSTPGGFELFVSTSDLCSGGPPSAGQIITHRVTLDANGAFADCSFEYQP